MDFVDCANVDETTLLSFERWASSPAMVNIDWQVHANRRTHHLPRAPAVSIRTQRTRPVPAFINSP